MSEPHVEKQKPVPPFVQFCCAAVPMVFDDSLSYYEALCAMWKYLDETVKVINNNALVTEDFIAKVNELHDYVENYFDNLDVQEEINNKLDAMVEDGTLQEIITTYIQANVAWSFNTVADMKLADNFINGSYAQTFGFHSTNDGGGALYKIRTVTNEDVVDEMTIIALANNTLVAELIVNEPVNIKQLGAYGDNEHDDTSIIQAVTNSPYTFGNLFFPNGTYIISSDTTIPSDITLEFADESMLNISEGVTLTINGKIEAQLTQIFTGTGVVRGNIKVTEVYPQWWGAKGDDSNSDSNAFQLALDYLLSQTTVSTIPKLKIPHGGYRITTGLVLNVDVDTNARIIIEGCGEGSKLNNVAKDQTILTLSATAGNIRRCIIRNLGFTNGQKAIELNRACYNTIEDCFFEEQTISSIEIKGSGGGSNIVTNNHFTHTAGIVLNNVGNILSNNQLGEDFRTTTYSSTPSHIYVAGSDNVIANNNMAVTELVDVQGIGIFINTANKNRIVNNRITSQLGSIIVQGDYNIISDNNIQGNRSNLGRDEIVIKSTSKGNIVSNNVFVSLGAATSPNIVSIENTADYNVVSYNIGYKQTDVVSTSTGANNVYSGLNTIIP